MSVQARIVFKQVAALAEGSCNHSWRNRIWTDRPPDQSFHYLIGLTRRGVWYQQQIAKPFWNCVMHDKQIFQHWVPEQHSMVDGSHPPWPMKAPCKASFAVPKPSSLHTTLAAVLSHMWSTIVPHLPSRSTSTRPSPSLGPAFNLTGCIKKWSQSMCNFIHTPWVCYSWIKRVHLTTTGYGAWGLPEEMRANWGPGTHLTTACLPFLQGVRLLGIDSWAWHSDREFSVPMQWTFSTQNPFFFDMRLSLERSKNWRCQTVLKRPSRVRFSQL